MIKKFQIFLILLVGFGCINAINKKAGKLDGFRKDFNLGIDLFSLYIRYTEPGVATFYRIISNPSVPRKDWYHYKVGTSEHRQSIKGVKIEGERVLTISVDAIKMFNLEKF